MIAFDPSRQIDFYFRVARDGSKTLTFVGDISSDTFRFLLNDSMGNGILNIPLTPSGQTVPITVTVAQTSIPQGGYVWELFLPSRNKTWLSGNAIFHTGVFDGVTETTEVIISDEGDEITVTISEAGASVASQSEVNTGTETGKYVSPGTLQDKDDTAVALVDGATIAITGPKHTLSTALGRTFTISHLGDDIVLLITLAATSATFTFPATALCVADGTASGDNTLVITGAVSGDKHVVAIIKVGSGYYVASKNVGQ